MTLKLDWCSHEAAKYAVEHWHYAGTMPRGKAAKIGVWEDTRFIGAVIFGCGIGNVGRTFGLGDMESAELVRVALAGHRAPVSRIVSVAVRMLTRAMPGLRLLVSYADPMHEHHGGIYQAMGWIYVGKTSPDFAVVDAQGNLWHSRHVSRTGVKVHWGKPMRVIRPEDGERINLPGKHKYLMPLDPTMRAQIAPLAKPYPKRPCAGSADSGTSLFQGEGGGAVPTPALQLVTQ